MAITPTDLRFFAAQYPTDDAYGGGPMSGNVVQDGISANVFPLIGETDAAGGRTQLRKVFGAVVSANADQLINTSVNVWTPPSDAQVDVLAFKWGDQKTTRAEAAAALATLPLAKSDVTPVSGDLVLHWTNTNDPLDQFLPPLAVSIAGGGYIYNPGGGVFLGSRLAIPSANAPKCCGAAALTAGVSSGVDVVPLSRVWGRVVPNLTPYPSAPNGIVSTALALTLGRVPIFRAGEPVVIRNAAGTTSELAIVERVNYLTTEVTFTAPLANSFASGSIVTSLVQCGDIPAIVGASFSQQTWTRVFADTLIGAPISATYNLAAGSITMTNDGSATERWAFVFTSATDFKLVGETLGQIATGSTATNFAPVNPHTSQPYFTITAAGWGTGWQVGNVWRLNTLGARAPVWISRCISPGATASPDGAILQMRGSY